MLKINKTIIVLPDLLFNYISDSFLLLAEMFAEVTNGEIVKYSNFNPKTKAKTVISIGSPSRFFKGEKFWKLPINTNFIYWIDDMGWDSIDSKKDYENTLQRADKVLCVNPVKFSLLWEKFTNKITYFPFFAPDYFLSEEINKKCIKKCLLAGRVDISGNEKIYPIRQKILKSNLKEVDILQHPKFGCNSKIKKDFAEEIKKYFCCVTDSHRIYYDFVFNNNEKIALSIFKDINKAKSQGQVVKKYFEIPATGSLLIADGNTKEEMDFLGFKDQFNYLKIDENNVIEIIKETLKDPEKYEFIRKNGLNLIKENHLLRHRKKLFSRIMSTNV